MLKGGAMAVKYQLKAILVTEDGENFLCIRQLYVNDLCTGQLIEGKIYQGKKFKLMEETKRKNPIPQMTEYRHIKKIVFFRFRMTFIIRDRIYVC